MAENSTLPRNLSENVEVISIVYIAFLTPSVAGSLSVLLVSLLRWKNLQEQRQLLVQLALADLFASTLLLLITVTNTTEYQPELCRYGLPLALVFYVLSFSLVISYACESQNVLRGWRTRPANCDPQKHVNTLFFVMLWLLFGGIYLVFAWIITRYGAPPTVKHQSCHWCLLFSRALSDGCSSPVNSKILDFLYGVVFSVAAGVILCCTVIYRRVSGWYQDQVPGLFPVEGDGQSRRRFKHVRHTARKMVVVVIVCWTPALLLFVLSFFRTQLPFSLVPLYVVQAVSVSLQGLLNSLVYAWKRPNFTEAVLGERTPLMSYHQAAFFEESLKTAV